LIAPSDHLVRDAASLRGAVAAGVEAARAGAVVIFGVRPDRPETGYGYVLAHGPGDGPRPVERFVEKPDRAGAEALIAGGDCFWNAGLSLFAAGSLVEEMARHRPDVLEAVREAVRTARRAGDEAALDEAAFAAAPSVSLDYAVLEKTAHAVLCPLDAGWSDVGSWSAVWDELPKDRAGNAVTGQAHLTEASGCLVQSDGPLVALAGVEDLVVVVHEGVVLVTRRGASEPLKELVGELGAAGRGDVL
jgi:mannose-1-phosphate guanylyltransferase/mannose-6-phosphate isomerase